jgi:hypothetical protein
MKRSAIRRLLSADFANLLDLLTTRQHLYPHEPLSQSLSHTVNSLGVCPIAIDEALRWLGVDPSVAVGRLRRTELTQLARSIHRFWRQRQRQAATATPRA